ncbi:MAG: CBS domain containing-hemolysin-like protein [Kiritimatiellia bacterium]|jgi:CBS domain containing-hemolysin-like protein
MLTSIIIIILLLVANAFFVAAEFALVKAKGFRIDALADEGSKSAKLTQRILRKLEPYLAACQLGITMASLALGWVGEPTVAHMLEPLLHKFNLSEQLIHTIAFITGFIIFSSLHIVVGEQVPKTFAIRKPEPVSLWIAYPLHWFYVATFGLNWMLNTATAALLGLFGVEEASHHDVLSDLEIMGLIETSEEHGTMESDKAMMLQNLFEFDTRTVEEIMVPRGKVACIDLQDPWEKQDEVLRKIQHSRFPVTEGGDQHLLGVLLMKDVYTLVLNGETSIEPHLRSLIREPLVVPETQTVGQLFERMRSERQHMSVVIDEYGAFAGIVTMEDLLEEIVGEIADELDHDHDQTVLNEKDGHWEADGWTQITDLERALDIEFPDELDANTLSGLFMVRMGRVPEVGDVVEEHGFRFTIQSMTDRRVNITRIEKMVPTDEETKPDEID